MAVKKSRTEYMKKFKDPKWESFTKCYEDCVKYRLSRRVLEGAHKPWGWSGWESSSESSGWSTPRSRGNRVTPLCPAAPPDTADLTHRLMELRTSPGDKHHCSGAEEPEEEPGGEGGGGDENVVENGPSDAAAANMNGFHNDTTTDNGPIDSASSDGEVLRPRLRQRPRRRPPRSQTEQTLRDAAICDNNGGGGVRKARAKSQPPTGSRDRDRERLDWSQTHMEARRTPNNSHTSDACVQTGRSKTGLRSLMRRARSADLEKIRKGQLSVSESPWVTEYMRCFSARVR